MAVTFSNSKDNYLEHSFIVLVGPPKHGKTFAAASISPKFPEILPSPTHVIVDDVAFILYDRGGLDGFFEQNVEISHVVDLSSTPGDALVQETVMALRETVAPAVRAGKIKAIVMDSWSIFANTMANSLLQKESNRQRAWGTIGEMQVKVFDYLRTFPCDIVLVLHRKSIGDPDAASKKSTLLPGSFDLVPDIPGQIAAGRIKGLATHIWPVAAVKVGKRDSKFFIYPRGKAGEESGSRIHLGLEDQEPANIYKILQKMKTYKPGESK